MIERLNNCYKEAVDEWDVDNEYKKRAYDDMNQHFADFSDFVVHKAKGRNPKLCELYRLWIEKIHNDPNCIGFIIDSKLDVLQTELQKNNIYVNDIADLLNKHSRKFNEIKEKIDLIVKRGGESIDTFWEKWSTGKDDFVLNYDIVLSGREKEINSVLDVCKTPSLLYVESSSREDAFAFVVASILKNEYQYKDRSAIVYDHELYNDLVENSDKLIIITNLLENLNYSIKKGHSIICCVTREDKIEDSRKICLPIVDRDGFVKSLEHSGFLSNQIANIMLDSKRESTALRRLLGICVTKPNWEKSYKKYLLPILLVGAWDESNPADKEIVSLIVGADYSEFSSILLELSFCDESPIIKVGSIWRVIYPKLLMSRYVNDFTQSYKEALLKSLDWILEDDDPDAIKKYNSDGLVFWKNKRVYSIELKNGLMQSLTLLSIYLEQNNEDKVWIDDYVSKKLNEFNFQRYLSIKQFLEWIAETSPSSFLQFLETEKNKEKNIFDDVFEVKHKAWRITTSEIYYGELLFCLEKLSWSELYLARTTSLLLRFSDYPNDSNYVNKPMTSLLAIYRFILPQTLVSSENRIKILQSLSFRFRSQVSRLCLSLLQNIDQTVFFNSSKFKWRVPKIIHSDNSAIDSINDIDAITKLLLDTSDFSISFICSLIELSMKKQMKYSRNLIIEKLYSISDSFNENEDIITCLRSQITKHERFKNSNWALTSDELKPFIELLNMINYQNIILKNKHYFDDFLIKEPDYRSYDTDYEKCKLKSTKFRMDIISDIINEYGIEGVMSLVQLSKFPESVADVLIELDDDKDRILVYKEFCLGKISERFAKRYFFDLYNKKREDKYLMYIEELTSIISSKNSILFYSPGITESLIELVNLQELEVQTNYWQNVDVRGNIRGNISYIIQKLSSVNRNKEIIDLLYYKDTSDILTSDTKLSILLEIFNKGVLDVFLKESYKISEILKTISLPSKEADKQQLLHMEFIIFNYIHEYFVGKELHLVNIVSQDPNMLMELICFAYLEDNEYRQIETISEEDKQNRLELTHLALIFFSYYREVPGQKEDGYIDEEFLSKFIFELKRLAIVYHRTKAVSIVIGQILGHIKETNDYPTDFMCQLVEELNDDTVDSEIGCCICNRRGFSVRSPFEGGSIERNHIATLEKYRERASYRSPRLAKVFDIEIQSFKNRADQEDKLAKLQDLKY